MVRIYSRSDSIKKLIDDYLETPSFKSNSEERRKKIKRISRMKNYHISQFFKTLTDLIYLLERIQKDETGELGDYFRQELIDLFQPDSNEKGKPVNQSPIYQLVSDVLNDRMPLSKEVDFRTLLANSLLNEALAKIMVAYGEPFSQLILEDARRIEIWANALTMNVDLELSQPKRRIRITAD